MTTCDVTISREDGVAVIAMTRPAKKNALTRAMYEAMSAALSESTDQAASSAAGANDFLTKPIQLGGLLEKVGASLGLNWVFAEEPQPQTASVNAQPT